MNISRFAVLKDVWSDPSPEQFVVIHFYFKNITEQQWIGTDIKTWVVKQVKLLAIFYLLHKRSECIFWQAKPNCCHFSNSLSKKFWLYNNFRENAQQALQASRTKLMTYFYCRYHFISPWIHSIFPFRKTFRYNRLWIEFLQKRDGNYNNKSTQIISKLKGKERCETWNRVFEGRGPTLHMYRHLRSGPMRVAGWNPFGISLNFSCISSSTRLLGTSTPSGVTPTCYPNLCQKFFSTFNKSMQTCILNWCHQHCANIMAIPYILFILFFSTCI